jgi:transposase
MASSGLTKPRSIKRIAFCMASGLVPKLESIRASRKWVNPPSSSNFSWVVMPKTFHLVPRHSRLTISFTASIGPAASTMMVYDRFHVMKLFNHYLTCLRRELYSKMKNKTLQDMLKGSRWLLLKNPENLNADYNEPKRLEEALAANQSLATGYYLKESLREIFWNCRTYEEAEKILDEWIADAKASNIRLIVDMSFTIERHRQGLLNYHLCPITTGPLAGNQQ